MPPSPPILLTRAPGSPRQDLAAYREESGYEAIARAVAEMSPASVIDAIEAAGLRGRGGACFSAAVKWRLAAEAKGREKFVVANGGEHEPGSELRANGAALRRA